MLGVTKRCKYPDICNIDLVTTDTILLRMSGALTKFVEAYPRRSGTIRNNLPCNMPAVRSTATVCALPAMPRGW